MHSGENGQVSGIQALFETLRLQILPRGRPVGFGESGQTGHRTVPVADHDGEHGGLAAGTGGGVGVGGEADAEAGEGREGQGQRPLPSEGTAAEYSSVIRQTYETLGP